MGDLDTVVALLTDDVLVTMPPVALEYEGRDLVERFFATVAFRDGRTFRLLPTRANGQPAFGIYVRTPGADDLVASGLLVISLAGSRIGRMTRIRQRRPGPLRAPADPARLTPGRPPSSGLRGHARL